MKILAVDTTAAAASAAICEDRLLLGEYYVNTGKMHSETLLPLVASLLKSCFVRIEEIGLFAVSSGPGSFTGVRIGVSAIKGLALPRGIPCTGISTLEALALNLWMCGGYVCAVMDARRGQFYNALFDFSGGSCERLCADRAVSADIIKDEITTLKKKVFLVGDGSELCYNILEGTCDVELAAPSLRYQRASSVAAAGYDAFKAGHSVSPQALLPFYLRPSQAERELKNKTAFVGG